MPDTTTPGPLTDTAKRGLALHAAKVVLTTKAGQYAERPLDVFDLLRVADWLLTGTDPLDVDSTDDVADLVNLLDGWGIVLMPHQVHTLREWLTQGVTE